MTSHEAHLNQIVVQSSFYFHCLVSQRPSVLLHTLVKICCLHSFTRSISLSSPWPLSFLRNAGLYSNLLSTTSLASTFLNVPTKIQLQRWFGCTRLAQCSRFGVIVLLITDAIRRTANSESLAVRRRVYWIIFSAFVYEENFGCSVPTAIFIKCELLKSLVVCVTNWI